MNRKQIISMRCGIAFVVFFGLVAIHDLKYCYGYTCVVLMGFGLDVFLVALVTFGLIYSFRDKILVKPPEKKEQDK
ncbi:MAG: hypothetical protein NTW55_00700 [Planctomycetota bacterium]|nr:hypothetical protein [Planctomycetota bacterium]